MRNMAGDAPTPFVATTGDQNSLVGPPAAGIGSGSSPNAVTSFSVEWWYRRDQVPLSEPGSQGFGIATHRFGFANGQFLYNVTNTNGNITVGTDAPNQMSLSNFVEPAAPGVQFQFSPRVHHYCFTFQDNAGANAGTGAIYRDGVLISSNVNQKVPNGWQAFEAIGPFSGTVDEIAVYPYALSAVQVGQHYSTGLPPQGFEDNIWQSVNDASGTAGPASFEDLIYSASAPFNPFLSGSVEALPSPGFIGDFMWPLFSPVAEGAPGFFNAEIAFDFSPPQYLQAIQGAGFLNSHQNVQYDWLIGSGSGGGGGGGGGPPTPPAPVIQNFNPGVGVSITSGTILSFDVVDATGQAPVYAAILANFVGNPIQELVYNSVNFNAQYSNASNTITPISGGFHFTLLRNGGWPGSVTLVPIAFSSGSENT
jgi:hypothetical protein